MTTAEIDPAETGGASGVGILPFSVRVLIVDDAEDNAEMLAELISSLGHHVRVAHLGAVALALLEQEYSDLVFLELTLPDVDGCEVARAIRVRFGKRPRIVALTWHSTRAKREAAQAAGCDAFVMKPFQFRELLTFLVDESLGVEGQG